MKEGEDRWGIKYQYPDRTCKDCVDYPCIQNQQILKCDFAKYGCKKYAKNNNTCEISRQRK